MSDKQQHVLLRAGYRKDELAGIAKWQATQMIDAVVKNNCGDQQREVAAS